MIEIRTEGRMIAIAVKTADVEVLVEAEPSEDVRAAEVEKLERMILGLVRNSRVTSVATHC
jgi:hypothetical protein